MRFQGTCGASGGGPVVCWGDNSSLQLGSDAGAMSGVPVYVQSP